jgi:hypothetical protein
MLSGRTGGRRGCAPSQTVEARAKRRADREADRTRYRGRARCYPNRAKDPKQQRLRLGGFCESLCQVCGWQPVDRPQLSLKAVRYPDDGVSMLSGGLTFRRGVSVGRRSGRPSRS